MGVAESCPAWSWREGCPREATEAAAGRASWTMAKGVKKLRLEKDNGLGCWICL